jgi:formiminotetrahydrofolate cyclodeaminase
VIAFIANESNFEQDINGDADKYDNIIAYLKLPVDSDGDEIPDSTEEPSDDDGSTYSITGLASMIENFVKDGSIDKRMKNSLLSKVDNAKASFEKGNIYAAVNQL